LLLDAFEKLLTAANVGLALGKASLVHNKIW